MKRDEDLSEEKASEVSREDERRSEVEDCFKSASPAGRRRFLLTCSLIFLVALGCRLLSWQDNRFDARKVQTMVTEGYKHTGRLLRQGGVASFFSPASELSDPNHLGHPPGYSILIRLVLGFFGEGNLDAPLQLIQIIADSIAAVTVFLICCALLNTTTATIAALLVAFAPQFTYNSVLLLPDSLAVLPILLAVYFLTRAARRPRLLTFALVGAFVGLSCWLRANAMLLAPFMAGAAALLLERGRRLRPALVLLAGFVLAVAPLTIRNALVYKHFVPVSLGAGQTLLEGISDYDTTGSLGIPNTDMGLMKWEAEKYGRPDYYGTLFEPDGVKRERMRLAYGFAVIRSHPFWFFGVMLRRAASMLRLERVRLVSSDPPVAHSLIDVESKPPAWSAAPTELLTGGRLASVKAEATLAADHGTLDLKGDDSKYDNQFVSQVISVEPQTDYLLRVPVRIEQGRMLIHVAGANGASVYATAVLEPEDWKPAAEQLMKSVELPFVSGNATEVRVVFANGGSKEVRPVVQIGRADLYALGPSAFTWTRVPRMIVRLLQKLFVTAVMLPLAVFGLALLILKRSRTALVLLLVVPVYYLSIQSALHTEYRYILAIYYFLFVLAALAIQRAGSHLWRQLSKIPLLQKLTRRFYSTPAPATDG